MPSKFALDLLTRFSVSTRSHGAYIVSYDLRQAPLSWYLKEFLILAVYVPLFAYMLGFDFLRLGASLTGWRRAGAGLLAGALLQSFSFCTLHDASHFGIWFKVSVRRIVHVPLPSFLLLLLCVARLARLFSLIDT